MDPNADKPGTDGQVPSPQPVVPTPQGGMPPQPPAAPQSDWQQGLATPAPSQQDGAGMTPAAPPLASMPVLDGQIPGQPAVGGPVMGMQPPKKNMPPVMILVIVGIVVVLVAAAVAYFMFFANKKPQSANNAAKTSTAAAAKTVVDMSTLTNLTLVAPTDMSAFQPTNHATAPNGSYLTKTSTDTDACSLIFGTVTPTDLPGTDLDSIVTPQVDALRKAGATVVGPTAAAPLILKDSRSSATYSMPTISYSFSQDKKHAVEDYSLVILKSSQRAVVSTQCARSDGAVDQAQFNVVQQASHHVTVTPAKS